MLVNIDRNYIRAYSPDPASFEPYPNEFWNTSVQAGVVRQIDGYLWKLVTGDPGCPLIDAQCPKTPLPSPYKSVRLYNLSVDPTEDFDVSELFPDVVNNLLERIRNYDDHSVPYYYPDKETGVHPMISFQ